MQWTEDQLSWMWILFSAFILLAFSDLGRYFSTQERDSTSPLYYIYTTFLLPLYHWAEKTYAAPAAAHRRGAQPGPLITVSPSQSWYIIRSLPKKQMFSTHHTRGIYPNYFVHFWPSFFSSFSSTDCPGSNHCFRSQQNCVMMVGPWSCPIKSIWF